MNSNKRDIYFEGRIYVGADEPPVFNSADPTSCDNYIENHLSTLTNYPVQDSHSFKDGENVTGLYKVMSKPKLRKMVAGKYVTVEQPKVALPTPAPVAEQETHELGLIEKIEYWTKKYELSFQFWGIGNNNVFINRDDVEIASFGDRETITEILEETIAWCEKANPRFNYSK